MLGWLLVYDADDGPASLEAFEKARALREELGDRAGETRALVGVCQVLVALGNVEPAEALSHKLSSEAGRPQDEALRDALPRGLLAAARRLP